MKSKKIKKNQEQREKKAKNDMKWMMNVKDVEKNGCLLNQD